jgi:hypothetical protein
VLYAAQNLQTALAETIIRDRFVGRARRYVGYSTLEGRAVTLISAHAPLGLLDIRGDAAYALGLDTDIGRARAHGPGQAFSEWLHLNTGLDGLLYDSRLTGRACIAVYDRALWKIGATQARPLMAHADLIPELQRLRIVVRKP